MNKRNLIALDLSKNTIQVAIEDRRHGRVKLNQAMSVKRLKTFLAKQPPSTVAMEACGSSHAWCWYAEAQGHETVLLPPQHVWPYRQGHKTDATDVLAVLEAAKRPSRKEAIKKTPEQLALQFLYETRERYVDQKRRLSNTLRAYLLEFDVRLPKGYAALKRELPGVLEDAENGLPERLRALVYRLYQSFLQVEQEVQALDREVRQAAQSCLPCRQLLQLEAVGPVIALGLYTRLGQGQTFKNGREAAASLGVTPQQHSTAGVAQLGHIRQKYVDKAFRAVLLQGARSVVYKLQHREPVTAKEHWLKALIQRRGERIAAVALVNKTIRTAWAMLYKGEDYIAV